MPMLIQEIVPGSQTALYTVISSLSRARACARRGTLSNEKREITIILVWTGCSTASSQVALQRMSDSKYLEIAVTPTVGRHTALSNENSTDFVLQSCTFTRANIWRAGKRNADATCTITHERLRFDSPQLRERFSSSKRGFHVLRINLSNLVSTLFKRIIRRCKCI